jgi:PAS domain S-box-containing protein
VLEDLTALRQAEAARRDTESRLRTVVETMDEGLLVVDRAGVIVECNAAACAALSVAPEQLRGRTIAPWDGEVFAADGAPLALPDRPVSRALRTGRPTRNAVVGYRRAGADEVRWLRVNAVPLGGAPPAGEPAEGKAPAGVVVTFADVTADRAAREALRASEEQYRGLVESLPLMLVQAGRDLRLLYANPAVREVSGYELAEVADPAAWAAHVHPDDLPRLRRRIDEALAGAPGRLEFRYRAKDGSEKSAFALVLPRRQGGAVAGVTTFLLDVTRERRLEQDLQRAQRLEVAGRLSLGVAHDLNNLLSVILTVADLARTGLPEGHPARDDLGRIKAAGEQAAGLAAQMLALGRRPPPLRRAPEGEGAGGRAAVNAAVRGALELLHGALPPGVRAEADLAPGEHLVGADETQLQQVLMNLCLNARDAMPRGGRLVVRTTAPAAGWVCLSVSDEGVGMDAAVRARVFEPFFSTKAAGAGLGLAVVRQIVEGCGGRIEVDSAPGRGARFDVWLPAAAEAAEAADPGRTG